MFDADKSGEVTWPEFCLGYTKVNRPVYANNFEDVFPMDTANFTALGVASADEVAFYDYNDDSVVEEAEWISAQIDLDAYYAYLAPGADSVAVADLLADNYTQEEVTFFDLNSDDFISLDEFFQGMKVMNTFAAFAEDGKYFMTEESKFEESFDINMD